MLVRTNIYLEQKVIEVLKKEADASNESMSNIIRKLLEKEVARKEDRTNGMKAMMEASDEMNLINGNTDLAKKHDKYLFG